MQTEIIGGELAIPRAVEELRAGGVIAIPTETVYGLAADALRPEAVMKIFEVKQRPRFNPLIVHLPHIEWLEKLADVSTQEKEIIFKLLSAFWPGPFTLVLPRTGIVPDLVTAGLDTVAVRMSSHPVFTKVIQAFGGPLAAPSANRFGRISPTTAQHVLNELDGRIPLIIDAGPTTHGLESTVVRVCEGSLEILRPGPISEDELRRRAGAGHEIRYLQENPAEPGLRESRRPSKAIGQGAAGIMSRRPAAEATTILRSPGQLPSHYAPKTPVHLVSDIESFTATHDQSVGLLAWNPVRNAQRFQSIRILSENQDLREAAANLFRYLRDLDDANLNLIVAELVPEEGIGIAINDRLRRAAGSPSGTPN